MTEQELRTLVREAIARHVAGADAPSHLAPSSLAPAHPRTFVPSHHASHGLFVLPAGADSDGPCIIEPSVTCNHCGHCLCYGH